MQCLQQRRQPRFRMTTAQSRKKTAVKLQSVFMLICRRWVCKINPKKPKGTKNIDESELPDSVKQSLKAIRDKQEELEKKTARVATADE